jgi:hypothetical protein
MFLKRLHRSTIGLAFVTLGCSSSWFDDVGTTPQPATEAPKILGHCAARPSPSVDAGPVTDAGPSTDATVDGGRFSIAYVTPDAGEGPTVLAALRTSLSGRSKSCLSCAETACPSVLSSCADLRGSAAAGPAKGKPLAALCLETTECLVKSACAVSNVLACYCGDVDPSYCVASDVGDGKCKAELQRSLETTSEDAVSQRFGNYAYAGGWATALVQCLSDSGCSECFEDQPKDH